MQDVVLYRARIRGNPVCLGTHFTAKKTFSFVMFLRIEGHGDYHHRICACILCCGVLFVLHVWPRQEKAAEKKILRPFLAVKNKRPPHVGQPFYCFYG